LKEWKILYRMNLERSLHYIGNYPKEGKTFWPVYYAPPITKTFIDVLILIFSEITVQNFKNQNFFRNFLERTLKL
jgi:hypothetical protein